MIKKVIPFAIFLVFVIIGVFTLDDHGLSWDETQQRIIGEVNYNYVFKNDTTLLHFSDKDYGVAFELPLMIIEKSYDFSSSRDIYLMRHFLTHLLFLISGLFLYFLILKLTQNYSIAIVGFLMLLLNPRVYAHSFFNTKDIPFLSFLIICFYLVFISFKHKTYLKFILLGAASAILINLRIIGVLLPLIVIIFLTIDAFKNSETKKISLKLSSLYLISAFLMLWFTWPYLWSNPFLHFKNAFVNMTHFRLNIETLFQGELIKIYDLPKSYAPVWIGITTPVLFLISSLTGAFILLYKAIKKPNYFATNQTVRQFLIYFAFIIAPFTAIFLLNSIVYDGWRQLYFIYPCLILMTAFFLKELHNFSKKIHLVIFSLFAITFISLIVFMIKNAPNQHVYFNESQIQKEGSYMRKNYEMDYWGAAYLTALKHILVTDQSDVIKISVANYPGALNVSFLEPSDIERIKLVDIDSATYFISNFRWRPGGYPDYENKVYYTVSVQENEIVNIYKLK